MGNVQSEMAHRKLSKELPPVEKMGWDDNHMWKDLGMKVFHDEKDREQFVYAVIAVATSNGLIDLREHEFRLLYSRRQENDDRLVATIVAVDVNGVMKAKIEPTAGGKDHAEAFKALKKDVEIKLDRLLQTVPDGNADGANSSQLRGQGTAIGSEDAPPSYSSAGVSIVEGKPKR